MKNVEQLTANNDRETTIYVFHANKNEVKLLYDLSKHYKQRFPKGVLELMPIRGRLNNMIKCFRKILGYN